ncbi:PLDc N-terminal domain-containing protein [Alkalihalobacterium elongatum]|uniref:PLDc N-terminal domain-containing protein n=1 Tax=Alkalihalobacterium elongatum TaxID=2675466 RepID=UPI001C1F9FAD|nr:PLDc N-terminal domain-containing protein [Alkalihalobacterium elongatum]
MTEILQTIEEHFMLIAPLIFVQVILIIIALIDLKRADATNGPKWLWLLIILIINIIGPILYFVIGRRQQ